MLKLIETANLECFFQLLLYSKQHLDFLAHRGALMIRNDLTSAAFCIRFADFIVLLCFCCKFSITQQVMLNSRLAVACFPVKLLFSCFSKWAKAW